jgi:hypothetical protein
MFLFHQKINWIWLRHDTASSTLWGSELRGSIVWFDDAVKLRQRSKTDAAGVLNGILIWCRVSWWHQSCMQLGKHVYVEKPLTRTPWEARLLTEADLITNNDEANNWVKPTFRKGWELRFLF